MICCGMRRYPACVPARCDERQIGLQPSPAGRRFSILRGHALLQGFFLEPLSPDEYAPVLWRLVRWIIVFVYPPTLLFGLVAFL